MNYNDDFFFIKNRKKFWFYVRKAIFQVFLQLLLALMSIWDFAKQSGKENNYAYNNLYFYTSLLLFFYTALKYILEYIFSLCSTDILFKKKPSLDKTTQNLFASFNMTSEQTIHYIVVIKKVFKLRYSKYTIFKYVDKLCYFLGIDSPILIPLEIANKLGNINNDLSPLNEDAYLNVTLTNLYAYHPTKINDVDELSQQEVENSDIENLIPKTIITSIDKSIEILQEDMFDK
ncbi:hypothetical protein H012_gp568 [Acanthamoeba polyphaga moumouvirus]|uniref:Uncharacterized protein n=1 Tax=Acanthamoeba polyphaga moumouvirus TaxID=1269028 RepID=L7RG13_9VIRU|nr:hypothetical protein H012_gp568 [Acanthamoeba polyphaga moumouvirus]AGC01895.1 hypothetical protein Moumou_00355 [Acanthamoeba polyphaga moumouvirus]AQN68254.1 hypothetical protein [Saudi moumouvirus]